MRGAMCGDGSGRTVTPGRVTGSALCYEQDGGGVCAGLDKGIVRTYFRTLRKYRTG